MLYLRNTNQIQSLGGGVLRGPAEIPPSPAPTSSLNYYDGLGRTVYNGFINPATNPNGFATAVVFTGPTLDTDVLIPFSSLSVQKSTQWLGYFKASTTETYTFYLRTDDDSVLWVGGAATASVLTTGSALLIETTHPDTPNSASISLTSGSYYPWRLQYADGLGAQYFTSSFSTPTISETKDYSGYIFANTASLGF